MRRAGRQAVRAAASDGTTRGVEWMRMECPSCGPRKGGSSCRLQLPKTNPLALGERWGRQGKGRVAAVVAVVVVAELVPAPRARPDHSGMGGDQRCRRLAEAQEDVEGEVEGDATHCQLQESLRFRGRRRVTPDNSGERRGGGLGGR